ncbi:MAG: trypsin-like peptidase domain-containing protein [Leptospiraceae bacterium]|nr:trypsin-like peptidase domain-containing protein [Leptospiraceae bacterium]
MKEYRLSRLALVNIIALAVLGGTLLSPLVYRGFQDYFGEAVRLNSDPLSQEDQSAAVALQKSFINVYKKASPSVVFIKTNVLVRSGFWLDMYRVQEQAGSGFVVDPDGYIVTNNHVVKGARRIEVIFHDSQKAVARLIGRDEASDVALIKVPRTQSYQVATIGNSDDVQVGQLAFALGAPFGLDRTFTVGSISAKQRHVDETSYSRIQTDASINPGNSGGPLLNIFGEVIGINQSILSRSGGNVGIGFAIPINEAMNVVETLRKEKRAIGKPTLGLRVGEPAENLRAELNLGEKSGVMVIQVMPASPAEDAGFKEYDFITRVAGENIAEPGDLVKAIQQAGVGAEIKVSVIRRGKALELSAVVGEAEAE